MKIKVVKAQHSALWYASRIGETFDNVEKITDEVFPYMTLINNGKYFFYGDDVEVVEDKPKFPFNVRCIDGDLSYGRLIDGEVYSIVDECAHGNWILEGVVGSWGKYRFEIVEDDIQEVSSTHNKYMREVKPGVWVDVYDVLRAWEVMDPCLQHLLKKALQPGKRHHKDLAEDLKDILASAKRAVEMYEEWQK